MYLCLDGGNTNIKLVLSDGSGHRVRKQVLTADVRQDREVLVAVVELIISKSSPLACCAVSVIPALKPAIEYALKKVDLPLIWFEPALQKRIRIEYKAPGADRIAAAYGGVSLTDKGFVVIDAGTAVTIDLVKGGGVFSGGFIVPGLSVAAGSLGDAAEKLPVLDVSSSTFSMGRDTASCIRYGLGNLYRGGLLEMLERFREETGEELDVLVTGGDGRKVVDLLHGISCRYIPDLVFSGLLYYMNGEYRSGR